VGDLAVALVQARLGSKRLPGKVLLPVAGEIMLDLLVGRVSLAPSVLEVVVSTSPDPEDDRLEAHCSSRGVRVSRHSVDDIVGRLFQALPLGEKSAKYLVRLWGDSPLICPDMIEQALEKMEAEGLQFFATGHPRLTYPAGLDFEIFSFELIRKLERECRDPFFREFPYEYIKLHPENKVGGILWKEDLHHFELSIDYPEDLEVVSQLVTEMRGRPEFLTCTGITDYCKKNSAHFVKSGELARNIEFKAKKQLRGEK